nr:LuxR C-terminal-related transcriptional regulator [uncultured Allomuricauda sp.]
MHRFFLIIVFLICGFQVSAQDAILGFVDLENPEEWETDVHLSKLSLNSLEKEGDQKPVAIAKIRKDGSFAFNKKYISESNELYRLSINRIRKVINDTVKKEVDFILSNKDFIKFKKGKQLFANFETSNQAQLEWQKFKSFESNLVRQYVSSEEMTQPRKGFVKDSLQILMVKLIGIKQLESKKLLDTDIAQNETYYLSLLSELHASDLDPSAYAFLERKLAYLTNIGLERELQQSRWINFGLFFMVFILGVLALKMKRRQHRLAISELSKQERTVRGLILQGKSNKEIANELFISLSTVKTHITSIYSKLNVANRQELLQKSTGTST